MPNTERIETLISPEALKQFEQLKASTDANTASFEKLIAKAVELNKAVGNASTFKEVNKATQEMTANEKALAKQVDELAKANAKLQTLYSDEAKKIAEIKVQQQQRNREIKEEIQLNKTAEGSIERKRLQIKQLQREYDNLSDAERNAAQGQELLKSVQALDKELKGLEGSTGRFQRNVGNYGGALKTLEGYLADVRAQITATKQAAGGLSISAPGPSVRAASSTPIRAADNKQQLVSYNQTVAQSSDRVQELVKQEQLLSRIVESQMAGFASATAEIKNNEKALQALGAAGLQNTEFYKALLTDTAQLKDNVGDLKDEIKALASDTRQFDLFAGAVTGLVNALQVGASAAELFAGENEDVQKSIQRLVALQNISQGIQQIANDLTTKGTALNKLYNFIIGEGATAKSVNTTATTANTVATIASAEAQETAAVATSGLTVATKVLRGALLASGIGLLVAGIVYLITKIQEWREADINLIKHQAELNQVTLESIRLNKELADITRTDFGTDIQALKNKIATNQAYGRSQGEVLAAEQALLKVQQEAAVSKFFDTGGSGEAERLKVELESAAKAYEEFIKTQAGIDPSDRNEKVAAAQKDLLSSNLELAKENYATQRKIVDDYYNYNNEAIAKQLQIERLNADERRKFNLETATISANAVIDANQRALDNEAATLKQRLALMQSTAEQQKRIARAQNQNVQNDPGASANDRLLAAKNATYQINKIERDSLEAQRKLREEYRKRERAAVQEVLKLHLEDQIKAAERIADNEKKSFDERTDALYESYTKRRQLITANYEFEREQARKSGAIPEELIAIEEKALSDINQLTIEYGLQQQVIYTNNQDKINDIIAKGQQARQDKISGDAAAANSELIKQLVDGKISIDKFNKEKDKAERDARILSIRAEIDDLSGKKAMLIMQHKEQSAEFIAIDAALNKKQEQLRNENFNKEIEAAQKLADIKKQLAAESVETVIALLNYQFDNESNRIQQQMDEAEKKKEYDIKVAEATISNKQQRETEIAKIEARAQAQRDVLEKRQRQNELNRARFEKAANIAQIISTTALAVIKTFKDYPAAQAIPLSIAIGALGALQLAKAIAAPLPKFAEGTDDAPGGLAWVGDGYRKELVITPQGKVMQTPAVPTVMNVPKHSIVLPDARAALESGLAVNQQGRLVQADNYDIKEVGRKIDTLTKVIRNKPVLNMNATESGLTAIWNHGANTVAYIDEQTRF